MGEDFRWIGSMESEFELIRCPGKLALREVLGLSSPLARARIRFRLRS